MVKMDLWDVSTRILQGCFTALGQSSRWPVSNPEGYGQDYPLPKTQQKWLSAKIIHNDSIISCTNTYFDAMPHVGQQFNNWNMNFFILKHHS